MALERLWILNMSWPSSWRDFVRLWMESVGDVLQRCIKRFRRGVGQVLDGKVFGQVTGEVLALRGSILKRWWRSAEEVLERFWRGSGEVPEFRRGGSGGWRGPGEVPETKGLERFWRGSDWKGFQKSFGKYGTHDPPSPLLHFFVAPPASQSV